MKIHDYIKTLGYEDDSPIEGVQLKVGTKFGFQFDGNGIVICPYVIAVSYTHLTLPTKRIV